MWCILEVNVWRGVFNFHLQTCSTITTNSSCEGFIYLVARTMHTVLDFCSITTPRVMHNTFASFRLYIVAYDLFNDPFNISDYRVSDTTVCYLNYIRNSTF
jgi:hypothetical protein